MDSHFPYGPDAPCLFAAAASVLYPEPASALRDLAVDSGPTVVDESLHGGTPGGRSDARAAAVRSRRLRPAARGRAKRTRRDEGTGS